MREPRGPAEQPAEEPRATQPAEAGVDNGLATLTTEMNRSAFEADVNARLAGIDHRIDRIGPLYDRGDPKDKYRESNRMAVMLNKREAIAQDLEAVHLARDADWALAKSDLILNMKVLEQALGDLEFVFRH
jgi:hypothetical protein